MTKFFLHVPKCGGISVHTALENALPTGSISQKRLDGSFLGNSTNVHLLPEPVRDRAAVGLEEVQALADFRVVSGHFWLTTLLQIAEPASIATVLREPRTRLLSQYAFWRFSAGLPEFQYAYEWLEHATRPLEHFLSDAAVSGSTDNLICRLLLAPNPRIPDAEFIAEDDVEALAGQAVGALDSLGFVGVIELATAMWRGLSNFFGVSLEPAHANRTSAQHQKSDTAGDPAFGNRTLELLSRRTAVDTIIYRYALSKSGFSASEVEAVASTAFARELIEFGNLSGSSADVARAQAATIMDLRESLMEGERTHAVTQAELLMTRQELQRRVALLEVVVNSSSWRFTRPVRAVARSVRDVKRSVRETRLRRE